ncbi:hypothetical protein ATANTOWER_013856 [Ataeniobius toweri]|uniref:Uncharacterized protein n=1 Tax=Ataeniobius toweri TaxID=208326 RepID=A0ABU7CF75_9TELE|nr:hypothetical protein [Ataeniobius toweri]
MMLKYTASQLLSLNGHVAPPSIATIRQSGILHRPRYIHRCLKKKFVYAQQIVKVPAHTRGHILDLVITEKASINNLEVYILVFLTIWWYQWSSYLRYLL